MDTLGLGGTELGLAKVIEGTQGRIKHSLCCVRDGGVTAARLETLGTPIRVLHKPPGNDWRLALRIAGLCREIRPDIVHTRNWGSIDGIVGAWLARVPVIIHGEHGRDATDPDGTNRRRNRARRLLSVFVDRVVTVSDQLGRWLIDDVGICERKVTVLKNGVDADKFQRCGDCDVVRASHGCSPEEIVVGTVGRLDPVKNQAALLEVLSELSPAYPNLRVVIVGDGPEREALEGEIKRRRLQNTAALLGHRDDIPAMLSMFDIFVLPSLGEGMCNTILEAMSVGLPVVATRVGGNPELVEDGVTGRLVASGDVAALTRAVECYASDERLRREHGVAGRARVLREFTLDAMVESYMELYENELEKKAAANRRGWLRIGDASRPAGPTRNHPY